MQAARARLANTTDGRLSHFWRRIRRLVTNTAMCCEASNRADTAAGSSASRRSVTERQNDKNLKRCAKLTSSLFNHVQPTASSVASYMFTPVAISWIVQWITLIHENLMIFSGVELSGRCCSEVAPVFGAATVFYSHESLSYTNQGLKNTDLKKNIIFQYT
jgi:hypothetical protein